MKAIVLSAKSPIHRPSLRRGFPPSRSYGAAGLLIPLVLVCFGLAPMAQAVGPDTDGAIPGSNNGEGIGVLVSRTGGIWNTGTGFEALNHLTAGNQNTATGLRALSSDINGGFNTATGVLSLFSNTSGFFNSASGAYSLANNTTGGKNTANGYSALYYNTEGFQNTATGFAALYLNTTGIENTANGHQALTRNTTGSENVANGHEALFNNTTGGLNTANGSRAGLSITGDGNVCIGAGVSGVPGENDTTWIRNINTTVQNFSAGVNDYVTVRLSDGRLGHTAVVSSRRYKEDIKPMDKTSQALYALKPVSFRLKKEFDATQALGFGLIAEDVEKVDSDLVYRNDKGQVESVRYEMVNAMLLNEFLKEHRKVEEQNSKIQQQEAVITELKSTAERHEAIIAQQRKDFEAMILRQQKEMQALTASLKEQAAQIQKVSAQMETSKPGPKMVSQP